MKTSNKRILIGSFLVGSSTASIMLWQQFPSESLTESLAILAQALVGWLATTVLVFLVAWFFFNFPNFH